MAGPDELLCEVCGWSMSMVCPECSKGCGCETRCSGWRHEGFRHPDDDDWTTTAGRASAAPATSTTVSAEAPDPVAVIARGLAVFALPPGGRRPTRPGWQHRCLSDPAVVRRLWRAGDNIGVGCRASNLVGLDLDRHRASDGIATFAGLCAAHGQPWPPTLTVRTPHGGLHLYFRAPAGWVIASGSGGRGGLGPGIDVRGPGRRGGGYLIGPGSIVDGIPYVIARDTGIQGLPAWLAGLLGDQGGLR